MDQKTSSSSSSPAKVDIMGTKLLHLLRQSTIKINELKEIVQKESELVGHSTASTIAPVLEKQELIKQNVAKCLSTIDNSFSSSGSTTSVRGRSLTVTVRDSELRRQAEAAAANSLLEGAAAKSSATAVVSAGPSSSSSSQDLKKLAKVDPVPIWTVPSPKRRSGSLERTKSFHDHTSTVLPGGVRVPSRRIFEDPAIEDSLPWFSNSSYQPPEIRWRVEDSPQHANSTRGDRDLMDFTLSRIPEPRFTSSKIALPLPPKHSYSSEITLQVQDDANPRKSFPRSTHESNYCDIMLRPRMSSSRELDINAMENKSSGRNYVPHFPPPVPTLSSNTYFPFLASSASLRSLAGPVQNEVIKPFETEDVEKYSTKRSSRAQSTATSSSQVSPALSSAQSDNLSSGSRDDEGPGQCHGGPPPPRPLRELQRNMDFFDFDATPGPAPKKGPGAAAKLFEERDWNLVLEPPKNATEENEYQWDFLPDSRELHRRVNTFRFTKSGMEIHPSVAIKKLQDIELRMLLEVVSREPWLLTPEETDYLLDENDARKGTKVQPPQLPPKCVASSSQAAAPPPLNETNDDLGMDAVDGAWGPVKPTIV